ncbi:MAG: hypothetical protein WKF75_10010 [Singulisphaera sp.]
MNRFVERGAGWAVARVVAPWLLAWSALVVPAGAQGPPPDATWTADAVVEVERSTTDVGLGAAQGVAVRDGKVYAYGDVFSAEPRVGVLREYDADLNPTGREVWLRKGGRPLILHPTGLTWDRRWGIPRRHRRGEGQIYRLDWERLAGRRPRRGRARRDRRRRGDQRLPARARRARRPDPPGDGRLWRPPARDPAV